MALDVSVHELAISSSPCSNCPTQNPMLKNEESTKLVFIWEWSLSVVHKLTWYLELKRFNWTHFPKNLNLDHRKIWLKTDSVRESLWKVHKLQPHDAGAAQVHSCPLALGAQGPALLFALRLISTGFHLPCWAMRTLSITTPFNCAISRKTFSCASKIALIEENSENCVHVACWLLSSQTMGWACSTSGLPQPILQEPGTWGSHCFFFFFKQK